jgi:hypothetical protein
VFWSAGVGLGLVRRASPGASDAGELAELALLVEGGRSVKPVQYGGYPVREVLGRPGPDPVFAARRAVTTVMHTAGRAAVTACGCGRRYGSVPHHSAQP